MTRDINRRIFRIEQIIPVPITRERFFARVNEHVQRTGERSDTVIATLLRDLSDIEFKSLQGEIEQVLFGSDVSARDAAKEAVLAGDRSVLERWCANNGASGS